MRWGGRGNRTQTRKNNRLNFNDDVVIDSNIDSNKASFVQNRADKFSRFCSWYMSVTAKERARARNAKTKRQQKIIILEQNLAEANLFHTSSRAWMFLMCFGIEEFCSEFHGTRVKCVFARVPGLVPARTFLHTGGRPSRFWAHGSHTSVANVSVCLSEKMNPKESNNAHVVVSYIVCHSERPLLGYFLKTKKYKHCFFIFSWKILKNMWEICETFTVLFHHFRSKWIEFVKNNNSDDHDDIFGMKIIWTNKQYKSRFTLILCQADLSGDCFFTFLNPCWNNFFPQPPKNKETKQASELKNWE